MRIPASQRRTSGSAPGPCWLCCCPRDAARARTDGAVVVVFASLVEFTFSPVARGLPLPLPQRAPPTCRRPRARLPGCLGHRPHGVRARTCARARCWHRRHRRRLGSYGVSLAGGPDVLGAFWFLCLLGFLRWGPRAGLVRRQRSWSSAISSSMGTSLGTWRWQAHDPTGLFAIGNPPSGAAGGYGWFDLAALLARAVRSWCGGRALSRRLPRWPACSAAIR